MKRNSSLIALVGLLICVAQAESTLFDFASNTGSEWRAVNDDVMGGVSTGRVGREDGKLVFSGKLSLENNGGFASVRSGSLRGLNLSAESGLNVRVRGDGRTYALNVNSQASRNLLYRGEFKTKPGIWLEFRLPFDDLKPTYFGNTLPGPKIDAGRLEYVGFILADKKPGPFTLEVDWIKTY